MNIVAASVRRSHSQVICKKNTTTNFTHNNNQMSPRRNAFEYGVLITLSTTMAASYAFLIAYGNQTDSEGKRRGIPKVDLDAEINLNDVWIDMKKEVRGMLFGNGRGGSPSSSGSGGVNNGGGGSDKGGPQPKK